MNLEARVRALSETQAIQDAFTTLHRQEEDFLETLCKLARIPAPTYAESARAEWVAERMAGAGLSEIRIDSAGNVVAELDGIEPCVAIAAHTDTVFGASEDHEPDCAPGKLLGRGVGDNSLGVAAMLEIAPLLRGLPRRRKILFAATVGEEGLGNLRGVRALCDEYGARIGSLLALEGHFLGRVVTEAVGSTRLRISFEGAGGHSWHNATSPSAVHAATHLGHLLTTLVRPSEPKTTLNIGRIEGGEGVNVVARHATMEVDIRSVSQRCLDALTADALKAADDIAAEHGLRLSVETIGERPAGSLDQSHDLVRTAAAALECVGLQPSFEAASTDANLPLSRGIPAISIGVTTGGGMHTPGEWIDTEPILSGLKQLLLVTAALAEVES